MHWVGFRVDTLIVAAGESAGAVHRALALVADFCSATNGAAAAAVAGILLQVHASSVAVGFAGLAGRLAATAGAHLPTLASVVACTTVTGTGLGVDAGSATLKGATRTARRAGAVRADLSGDACAATGPAVVRVGLRVHTLAATGRARWDTCATAADSAAAVPPSVR